MKDNINRIAPAVLAARGIIDVAAHSGYICPNCGNGSGQDGTGIIPKEYKGKTVYHCFRCGATFDNLALIAAHGNLDLRRDFPKILAEGATLAGAAAENFSAYELRKNAGHSAQKKCGNPEIPHEPEEKSDYSNFLAEVFANIEELPQSARRGLTLETFEHFNCGFAAQWQHPKANNAPKTERIIVPTSNHHYLARAISNAVPKEFQKMHVGKKEIFNVDALKSEEPIMVVEGEFDAMSIWQASGEKIPVVAVGGATSYNLLLKYLDDNAGENCTKSAKNLRFVVMFDNDEGDNPGQSAAAKLVAQLIERGYPAVNRILSERKKFDANNWLIENEEEFTMKLVEIYESSKAEFETKAAEIRANAEFEKELKNFEFCNECEINPEVLPKIKAALDEMKNFVPGKISVETLMSDEFKNAVGYVVFYDLISKGEIIARIKKAKNLAKAEIKNKPAEEISADTRNMADFDNFDYVKQTIGKSKAPIEKAHELYNKRISKIRRREMRKKEREEQKLQTLETMAQGVKELDYLYTLPQSAERDAKIIETIRESLEWKKDRSGVREYVKSTDANYELVFTYDPLIRGAFGYSEFAKMDMIMKKLPWHREFTGDDTWSDSDDANLRCHIGLNYKDMVSNHKKYYDFFDRFSRRNTFHPIKRFLENLPEWDGIERAEKIFIDFLKVEDTPYAREVTFKTLIAAIARIYNPGCEWQYMPVLQGKQGIGKGHILKALGDPWYMELVDSVESSHAIDAIQKGWFVEISELQSFGRASINKIKAFVSAREDTHRFAYARKATTVKRSNIFVGTTNDSHPLEDTTGARRFLMLVCGNEYCQYVTGLTKEYILQIWAEVFQKYAQIFKDGFDNSKLKLSAESEKYAAELAGRFTQDDGMVGEIIEFLDTPIPYNAVWSLLSKEERRKFIADKHIAISAEELIARQNVRRRHSEMEELLAILNNADNDISIRKTFVKENGIDRKMLVFYGAELRNIICAAEVYNECFGNDRRKSMKRIAEILDNNLPAEWTRTSRKKTVVYGDQRNVFVRDVKPLDFEKPEEIEEISTEENISEVTETQVEVENVNIDDFENIAYEPLKSFDDFDDPEEYAEYICKRYDLGLPC